MNSWEDQWRQNSNSRPFTREPRTRANWNPNLPTQTARFHGVDPSVHYVSPQPMVMPQPSSGGGSFSNGVLLVLAGFATGTLFGESWIGKMLGDRHRKPSP
jgi:hypothetical protein